MGPGKYNLGPFGRHLNFRNISTHPVGLTVILTGHLFTVRQQSLGTAKIDNQIAPLITTDNTVNNFTDTILEFIINTFALSLTNFLDNHLFGGLRGDPAETARFHQHPERIANFDIRVNFPCFFNIDFFIGVNHLIYDGNEFKNINLADLFVEMSFEVSCIAKFLVCCRQDC